MEMYPYHPILLIDPNKDGEEEEIQHPWHPHPLLECYIKDGIDFPRCKLCDERLFGSRVFGCHRCDFYLHDGCAELPTELQHPLHPTHPLQLGSWGYGYAESSCALCNRLSVQLPSKVIYFCRNYNNMCFEEHGLFFMDSSCALLEPSNMHPSHEHPLVFIKEYGCLASCAACGSKIQHGEDDGADIYRCLECNIRIHQGCFDTPIKSELQVQSVQQCRSTEIHHWLHSCPLLEIMLNEKDIMCILCQSLVSGLVYGCQDCRFFLHQHCAKAPRWFLHPLHMYPIFMRRVPNRSKFTCDFCYLTTDSEYVYHTSAKANLHVYCAALKPTWHHLRHEHPFVLIKEGHLLNSANCPACGTEICSSSATPTSYYLCWTCNISFHARCFNSPSDIKLDRHHHPLTLHFDPLPVDYDHNIDYFCDACNEKRDVHTYSYVCRECDYIAHIRCDLFDIPQDVIYEKEDKECQRIIAEQEAALDDIQKHIEQLKQELCTLESKKSAYEECIKEQRMKREEIRKMSKRY